MRGTEWAPRSRYPAPHPTPAAPEPPQVRGSTPRSAPSGLRAAFPSAHSNYPALQCFPRETDAADRRDEWFCGCHKVDRQSPLTRAWPRPRQQVGTRRARRWRRQRRRQQRGHAHQEREPPTAPTHGHSRRGCAQAAFAVCLSEKGEDDEEGVDVDVMDDAVRPTPLQLGEPLGSVAQERWRARAASVISALPGDWHAQEEEHKERPPPWADTRSVSPGVVGGSSLAPWAARPWAARP